MSKDPWRIHILWSVWGWKKYFPNTLYYLWEERKGEEGNGGEGEREEGKGGEGELKQKKEDNEKEKENQKEKAKAKMNEKKVEVVICDVKWQYPFESFNIDKEGPTELMLGFSQWINEGLYKHHAKK